MKRLTRVAPIKSQKQKPPRCDTKSKHQNKKSMLLSCMDYRFVQATLNFLAKRYCETTTDTFVLAGASLGFNTNSSWSQIYLEHVDLAIRLHAISRLTVVDHWDCGYYESVYPDVSTKNMVPLHKENISTMLTTLRRLYPDLLVEGFLLRVHEESGKIVFQPVRS